MLQFVLQRRKFLDDLLPLGLLSSIVGVAHGAIYIIDRLSLVQVSENGYVLLMNPEVTGF